MLHRGPRGEWQNTLLICQIFVQGNTTKENVA